MNVLFLSRWFPYPADNGSRIRINNVLRHLARRHDVSLVSFEEHPGRVTAEGLETLRKSCSSIRTVPYRPFQPRRGRALAGLLSPQPRSLVDTRSPEMDRAIDEELARWSADVVVASQIDMVPYAATLPVPAILEELELTTFRDSARGGLRGTLTWLKLASYLRRTLPRFRACTVVSERERELVHAAAPGYAKVKVIPNALDLGHYAGEFGGPHPNTLLFSGALTYRANLDAARYFLGEIFPLIRRAAPGITFEITGSTHGVDLSSLPAYPGIDLTGHVPDIRPVIAGSWVSVVPLRIGGGTRLKILESMALGTPVVSTRKGAEGLDVTDGRNILLADTPAEFATRVADVLRSPTLRERLASEGRMLVRERYDWRVVGEELTRLVECAA